MKISCLDEKNYESNEHFMRNIYRYCVAKEIKSIDFGHFCLSIFFHGNIRLYLNILLSLHYWALNFSARKGYSS